MMKDEQHPSSERDIQNQRTFIRSIITEHSNEFTITIDIDDAKFEMTYGQAALILMALKGIYNK